MESENNRMIGITKEQIFGKAKLVAKEASRLTKLLCREVHSLAKRMAILVVALSVRFYREIKPWIKDKIVRAGVVIGEVKIKLAEYRRRDEKLQVRESGAMSADGNEGRRIAGAIIAILAIALICLLDTTLWALQHIGIHLNATFLQVFWLVAFVMWLTVAYLLMPNRHIRKFGDWMGVAGFLTIVLLILGNLLIISDTRYVVNGILCLSGIIGYLWIYRVFRGMKKSVSNWIAMTGSAGAAVNVLCYLLAFANVTILVEMRREIYCNRENIEFFQVVDGIHAILSFVAVIMLLTAFAGFVLVKRDGSGRFGGKCLSSRNVVARKMVAAIYCLVTAPLLLFNILEMLVRDFGKGNFILLIIGSIVADVCMLAFSPEVSKHFHARGAGWRWISGLWLLSFLPLLGFIFGIATIALHVYFNSLLQARRMQSVKELEATIEDRLNNVTALFNSGRISGSECRAMRAQIIAEI